jgi:hypothetical protein
MQVEIDGGFGANDYVLAGSPPILTTQEGALASGIQARGKPMITNR